jgi:hypothetical protein
MVIGYKYIELRGSSCFVYDVSRKCDGKLAVVVMVISILSSLIISTRQWFCKDFMVFAMITLDSMLDDV